MQTNLYLCKLPPAYTDAHLLLNEQINASISRELNRKGIRIDEINGKKLDRIIKKESRFQQEHRRESEFDPFYYFEHELDHESVAELKSNEWRLHVDFQEHYRHQEKVYKSIMEKLSRPNLRDLRSHAAQIGEPLGQNRAQIPEEPQEPGGRGVPGGQ